MRVITDTHVHIYPSYNLASVFEHAFKNIAELSAEDEPKAFVLCLTESEPNNFFEEFRSKKRALPLPFTLFETSESTSIRIQRENQQLFVIAGRQINTREGLEVHALGTSLRFSNGLGLLETIEAILKAQAIVVIPWSPGKWFFKRGQLVKAALQQFGPKLLFVADSRLRPAIWGTPRLLQQAKQEGFRILAGSDPLPIPADERFIGTYATSLEGNFDHDKPCASLALLLQAGHISLLGKRCDTLGFLRSNIVLRLKKAQHQ